MEAFPGIPRALERVELVLELREGLVELLIMWAMNVVSDLRQARKSTRSQYLVVLWMTGGHIPRVALYRVHRVPPEMRIHRMQVGAVCISSALH